MLQQYHIVNSHLSLNKLFKITQQFQTRQHAMHARPPQRCQPAVWETVSNTHAAPFAQAVLAQRHLPPMLPLTLS